MIQFDKDGVTLYYIDADGKKVSHTFMDVAGYSAMLDTRDAQIQAAKENMHAQTNYETALANAQGNLNIGQKAETPTKPLMKTVTDLGAVSWSPFDPPLKDLVPPAVIPTASGTIKRDTSQDDKLAIMYNMILAMFRKTFPDA